MDSDQGSPIILSGAESIIQG